MEMKTTGEEALTVGSFVVTPSGGMIPPAGGVVRVALVFNAEGQRVSRDKLVIQYSGRDPSEFSDPSDVFSINSQGVPLVLLGESCTPGINVDNLESIFEEQVITRTGSGGGGASGGSGGECMCVYVCMWVCGCGCVCVDVWMCMCVYVYYYYYF